MDYIRVFEIMASVLFAIYLFWGSMQDAKEMKVARYTHLLGLVAIIWIMIARGVLHVDTAVGGSVFWRQYLWEIIVVWLLQFIGYKLRFYGLADVFVIGLCASFYYFESEIYRCLFFYFVLYATSGILLLLMQLIHGNLKGFRLKEKVAFIPYISIAFFLTKWVV